MSVCVYVCVHECRADTSHSRLAVREYFASAGLALGGGKAIIHSILMMTHVCECSTRL